MSNSTPQDGFVYIFRHDRLHNEIKVGLSKSPFKRLKQLYTTATATPMNINAIWWVGDMRRAERIAHERLADHRISSKREFFLIAPPNDFDEYERMSYDLTSDCLDILKELIEGDWGTARIPFAEMDVDKMYEEYSRDELASSI